MFKAKIDSIDKLVKSKGPWKRGTKGKRASEKLQNWVDAKPKYRVEKEHEEKVNPKLAKSKGPWKRGRKPSNEVSGDKRTQNVSIGRTAFWGKVSSKEFKSPSEARKFIQSKKYLKYPEKEPTMYRSLNIEKPFEKSRSHKYIKREGSPKSYRYIYRESPYSKQFDFKEKRVNRAIQKLHEGKTFKMEMPFGLHKPTEKEMQHEHIRISTMSDKALDTRIRKIKDPQKLFAFAQALDDRGYNNMAITAYAWLKEMGYHRGGEPVKVQIPKKVASQGKIAGIEEPFKAKLKPTGNKGSIMISP